MPNIAALPVELLENIFRSLPAASLPVLACTTSSFYHPASLLLYRHISVSSFAHNLNVVTTLASRRHLALLVRNFSISLDDGKDQLRGEYYALLAQAISGMDELISLDLNVDAASSWILATQTRPFYRRLEHFSCSFPLDAHTASFLERTPELRSLQLATAIDCVRLSSDAIPHLTTYTGPSCLLTQLVPFRPITALHLSGDLTIGDIEQLIQLPRVPIPVSSSASPELGQSADVGVGVDAQVKTLSAITSSPPVPFIKALAKACPGLVHLQVITTCAFWETPDITSSLFSLTSLRAFELSGMHWVLRPRSASAADGTWAISGKEWVSPPVTPRPVDVDVLDAQDRDFDFTEAFMEWAY